MALGNTGSKTTIHKYLKELEEEEGAGPRKASISEALQDLVERLAARLQEEADESIVQAKEALVRKEQEHVHTSVQLQNDLAATRETLQTLEARMHSEAADHAKTRAALQAEIVIRHTAEQQVTDLKERLAENEQHRKSLEDKHTHARDALEHYRQSVKDQRDQDQRRHELQVQQVQAEHRQQQQALVAKQDEVTRLNQEGARLVAELSHTKQSLYEQLSQGRRLEQKLEQQQSLHQHADDLERQLASKIAESELLAERLKAVDAQLAPASARARELELQLAEVTARALAQEQIEGQLRVYLDKILAGPAAAGSQS